MNVLAPLFLPLTARILPNSSVPEVAGVAPSGVSFAPSASLGRLLKDTRPFALAFTLLSGCGGAPAPLREAREECEDMRKADASLQCEMAFRFHPEDLDIADESSIKLPGVFSGRPEEAKLVFQDLESIRDLLEPVNGSYPVRFRVLRDRRFHAFPGADPDTVHRYAYAYVPPSAGLGAEGIMNILHHAENYAGVFPGFSRSSLVVSRKEMMIELEIDLGTFKEAYKILTPEKPVRIGSNILSTHWSLVKGSSDFFRIHGGVWTVIPVKRGGYLVMQGMIANSRLSSDSDPAVEAASRESAVQFLTKALGTKYAVGRVIDERGVELAH